MPHKRTAGRTTQLKNNTGANLGFDAKLWGAVDSLRKTVEPNSVRCYSRLRGASWQ